MTNEDEIQLRSRCLDQALSLGCNCGWGATDLIAAARELYDFTVGKVTLPASEPA